VRCGPLRWSPPRRRSRRRNHHRRRRPTRKGEVCRTPPPPTLLSPRPTVRSADLSPRALPPCSAPIAGEDYDMSGALMPPPAGRQNHGPGRVGWVSRQRPGTSEQVGEEVVALVVGDDERGEVLDLDPPDRLHAELR